MGETKVTAKTDGSLQIQIPDNNALGGSIPWTRQYYALPLEVTATPHLFPAQLYPHAYPLGISSRVPASNPLVGLAVLLVLVYRLFLLRPLPLSLPASFGIFALTRG